MAELGLDLASLTLAWRASVSDIRDVCSGLDEAQWQSPTGCPGWTVADILAHVVDAESIIAGRPPAEHQPDFSSLPHVASDFSRLTEVGVDARRARPTNALLVELDEVIAVRERQLAEGPQDLTSEVPAFTATRLPLGRLLTMRTFDIWVHSQDIRDAVDAPGGLHSPGAQVTAEFLISALPRIWGKSVAAPPGAVLVLDITGPGIVRRVAIEVMPDGRATQVQPPSASADSALVSVSGSWPALVHLMTGRPTGPQADTLQFHGDADLIALLAPALNIAP